MPQVKKIKLIFYIAAMLLAAKPFLGFSIFEHFNSPVETNIFAKVFTKRLLESDQADYAAIEQQLSHPLSGLFLRFTFFLSILFPFAFKPGKTISSQALHQIGLSLLPRQLTLLTGQLLI